jgi:hypothetical protein
VGQRRGLRPAPHLVRAAARPARRRPRGQSLRQRRQPGLASPPWDPAADRPAWDRIVGTAGPAPLEGGAGAVVAELLQTTAGAVGPRLGGGSSPLCSWPARWSASTGSRWSLRRWLRCHGLPADAGRNRRSQPQRHLGGLHGLVDHAQQLASQVSRSICWRSRALNAWIVLAAW